MNTVHEPGPPMTLKYHQSKNQFKSQARCTSTQQAQQARPGVHWRAQARAWLPCPQPCRGKGPAVSQQQCRSSRAHPPAPQHPAPLRQRLLAQPTAPAAARPRAPAPPAPAPVPPSAPAPRLPRAPCTPSTHARPAPTCAPRAPPARPAARLAPAQLHNLLQYDFQTTAPKFFFFFHDK